MKQINIVVLCVMMLSPLSLFAFDKCQDRYVECQKQNLQTGVTVNAKNIESHTLGFKSIEETDKAIIVKNIKIIHDDINKPALRVITNPKDKKKVLIKDVLINSKYANIQSNSGMAGLVELRLSNEGNTTINGLEVNSAGGRYISKSNHQQNAAGTVVTQLQNKSADSIDIRSIKVNLNGRNMIDAIQNTP